MIGQTALTPVDERAASARERRTSRIVFATHSAPQTVTGPSQTEAAAAAAMGRQGAELQVVYPDDGGDRVSAVWTVREPR